MVIAFGMKFTQTDMALLPNGTVQDDNLVQAMLTAVFFNIIYFFVIAIDAMSFVFSKRSFNVIKRLLLSINRKKFTGTLKIPHHMAVAFGVEDLINLTVLCDFIICAAENGVRQLSFYDPDGVIVELFEDLKQLYATTAKRQALHYRVHFVGLPEDSYTSTSETSISSFGDGGDRGLQVRALSRRDGKDALIDICKELSQTRDRITSNLVNDRLEERGVFEVDFLVTVGCGKSLRDFPPWSLRVTEILTLNRLNRDDRLSADDFQTMLQSYSSRDRRMGH